MGEDLNNIDCRDDSRHKTYVQKWSHSGEYDDNDDDDDGSEDSGDMQDYSTLPVFADDECRNIYRATLELESKCDRKSRRTKQFKDRLKTMQDHMHHIRQEIDLTNSLIAADKDDIRAEEHLLALGQRERANILAEMKEIDQSLIIEERQMKSLEARKAKATEETESLKLALNCNQEELEQWAKAAATKETDYLTLEKYTRADDVKIKELTMKLEAKTTLSLAKKIELENEVMETQNQRLEFERTLKMFHNEQKERQSMMSQLQEALEFIERKDHEIHQLSRKYSNLDFDLNKKLQKVIKMRRSIEEQRAISSQLGQILAVCDRDLTAKRQDLTSLQQTYRNMVDEFDFLRMESKTAAIALKNAERDYKVTEEILSENCRRLQQFLESSDLIKKQLTAENKMTLSHTFSTQDMQQALKEKEKEYRNIENMLHTLKDQLFRDSQALEELHGVETTLHSEITSTQASGKNLSMKLRLLEDQQLKQNDTLHRITFQVDSMEKKVARGLGKRSDEERRHLLQMIAQLENEHLIQVERKKKLLQQCKSAEINLKDWQKRKRQSKNLLMDVQNQISALSLDIASYDQSIKHANRKKEDVALYHDSVRLEMTRLRNLLAIKITELCNLQDLKEETIVAASKEKEKLVMHKDIKSAELKLVREDLHKVTVEAGRKCITAQTAKSKYEAFCKIGRTNGNTSDEWSNVKSLVSLAQKQAELQQQGDSLDKELTKREKGIRSLQIILRDLRGNNQALRRTLVTIPSKVVEKHESHNLSNDLMKKETELFESKARLRNTLRKYDADKMECELLSEQKKNLEEEYVRLSLLKDHMVDDLEKLLDSLPDRHIQTLSER